MIDIEPICECECSEEGSEGYDFTSEHCDYHGEQKPEKCDRISTIHFVSMSQETLFAENASVLTDQTLVNEYKLKLTLMDKSVLCR